MKAIEKDRPDRRVNNLLHNLRGEHYRHLRNLHRTNVRLPTSGHTHDWPSLPTVLSYLTFASDDGDDAPQDVQPEATSGRSNESRVAGPSPPPSWIPPSSPEGDAHDTPKWRAQALSLVLDRLQTGYNPCAQSFVNDAESERTDVVPPLSLMCMRLLFECLPASEFSEEIVPYIPDHLRRDLIRDTAVRSPLPNFKLYPLLGTVGHADGEVIVIGPYASLRGDHFRKTPAADPQVTDEHDVSTGDKVDWDSPASLTDNNLTCLMLLSTPVSVPTLLSFPPTLTHLALIDLPSPVPLHRLPGICPQITVLDLSHNKWLDPAIHRKAEERLLVIRWTRWNRLKVLGMRSLVVSAEILASVNKDRWDDVEIIY